MSFASIIILAAYVALISSPYILRKYGQANTDHYGAFAIGSRNFGWFRIAAGLSATFIGGAAVINTASMGYTYGWFAITDALSTSLALLLSSFVVVPLLFRKRAFSLGSFLRESGRLTAIVSGLLSTVVYTLITAAQIVALLRILQPYFSISPTLLATFATIGIAAYIFFGGYSAVTVTDVIQFITMSISYFAVTGFFLFAGTTIPVAQPIQTQPMPLDLILLLALPLLFVPVSQDVHIRIHSAKAKRDATVGILLAGLVYLLFGFISVSVGTTLARNGVTLVSPDNAVPTFINTHFGSMAIIPSIAILAAVMSTLDSVLFAAVTSLSYDVLDNISSTERHREKDSGIPRLGIGCILLVALFMALRTPSILHLILSALVIYVSVLLPMLAGVALRLSGAIIGKVGLVVLVAVVALEVANVQLPYRAFIYCGLHMAIVLVLRFVQKHQEELA